MTPAELVLVPFLLTAVFFCGGAYFQLRQLARDVAEMKTALKEHGLIGG